MLSLGVIGVADAAAFRAVRLRTLQDTPNAFAVTYDRELALTDADWAARIARWVSPTSTAYLATGGSLTAGLAAAGITDSHEKVAELFLMWVTPERRRLGVGRMLVDAAVAWGAPAGCRAHAAGRQQ